MEQSKEKPRVLVVDDEVANLETFQRVFRTEFVVTLAASAAEAVALTQRQKFDVALVDYAMPHESGVSFLRRAASIQPEMARAMLTAHGDLDEVKQAYADGLSHAILMKPWDKETVLRWVSNAVKMAALKRSVFVMKDAVDNKR